ncbi:uncharacterized membrane protein YhaH (DUF805 family) [Paenibacillus rhizosphaerae]|uniref:Uncharacterized membrane protein YhaH (DUF805 family) n=1 Tax=Paenibacillus rhizosphaerae TaxID=297318 RepID=A0A839TYC5_9BACL|nr:DUF805 domain-containing protein [Paenibacillus rhizosphaerae]MBB3131461.1 uncharacterized membrane protein YhaH (DUF805 family) [Paenibacillus rhizosphaerae]
MAWYLQALKNYTGFQGRASKKEYWMFMLYEGLIYLMLSVVEEIAGLSYILSGIYFAVTFLPALAVACRRLHDTGRSGWWNLIVLVPVVGIIIFIVQTCQASQETDNPFGSKPVM